MEVVDGQRKEARGNRSFRKMRNRKENKDMNYKGLTFDCTMSDFKRWTREFPPLEDGQDRKYYQYGEYFMSLEAVRGETMNLGQYGFIGLTLRKYDSEQKDFVCVSSEERDQLLDGVFAQAIKKYVEKHQLPFYR